VPRANERTSSTGPQAPKPDGQSTHEPDEAQFAEKKGYGAELALLVLIALLHSRKGIPTFLAYVDIKGAYDALWKEGLFFKLYAKGVRGSLWTLLVSVVQAFPTRISHNDEVSELIKVLIGLAQGSPLSGYLFTNFLSDLEAILKDEVGGIDFLGLIIIGIFFMDDLTLIAPSATALRRILELLDAYAKTWRLAFAPPPKSGVLVLWSDDSPSSWTLGSMTIPTTDSATILGVIITDKLDGAPYLRYRMEKAWKAFHAFKNVGLLCGALPLINSSLVVSSVVWPSLDYGRIIFPTFAQLSQIRKELDVQLLTMGRQILGVSMWAPNVGILGELSWLPDSLRECWYCLLFYNRFHRPENSNRWTDAMKANKDKLQLPLFKFCVEALVTLGQEFNVGCSVQSWKTQVAAPFMEAATESWRASVLEVGSLWLYAKFRTTLNPTFISTMKNFRGRDELISARLACLNTTPFIAQRPSKTRCLRCDAPLELLTTGDPRVKPILIGHILFDCPHVETLRAQLLSYATWLPSSWDKLPWADQIGHLLLLPDGREEVRDEEAAIITGAYIVAVLEYEPPRDRSLN
jgi:hypothetical protein